MWGAILNLSRLETWPGVRRGLLLRFGLAWVMIGVLSLHLHQRVSGAFHTYLPAWTDSAVWIATGAFAAYAAVRRDRHDDLGWAVLTFMPSVLFASYGISFLLGLADLLDGDHYGDIGSAHWAIAWALCWTIVRSGAHITPSPP